MIMTGIEDRRLTAINNQTLSCNYRKTIPGLLYKLNDVTFHSIVNQIHVLLWNTWWET